MSVANTFAPEWEATHEWESPEWESQGFTESQEWEATEADPFLPFLLPLAGKALPMIGRALMPAVRRLLPTARKAISPVVNSILSTPGAASPRPSHVPMTPPAMGHGPAPHVRRTPTYQPGWGQFPGRAAPTAAGTAPFYPGRPYNRSWGPYYGRYFGSGASFYPGNGRRRALWLLDQLRDLIQRGEAEVESAEASLFGTPETEWESGHPENAQAALTEVLAAKRPTLRARPKPRLSSGRPCRSRSA